LLGARIRWGTPDVQREARWWVVVSLRYQGRLREALAVARELRAADAATEATPAPYSALMEAQVLFEMERYREAAALFEAVARQGAAQQPAVTHRYYVANAAWPLRTTADTMRIMALADTVMESDLVHHRTWYLGHAARALVAAGDRAGAARLAETIAAEGTRSGMARDRNLHHHVAGLLLLDSDRPVEAARAFRSAQISPYDFPRNNLELGRALLRAARPAEAVPVLQAGVRGEMNAGGLYATKTELHELLGEAFDAAGQPDSAVVHYRWVLNAWRSADRQFATRIARIRKRLP
jgi:tetratricopeptide (TPR) repeat protein